MLFEYINNFFFVNQYINNLGKGTNTHPMRLRFGKMVYCNVYDTAMGDRRLDFYSGRSMVNGLAI
jgi:hypothetical protein